MPSRFRRTFARATLYPTGQTPAPPSTTPRLSFYGTFLRTLIDSIAQSRCQQRERLAEAHAGFVGEGEDQPPSYGEVTGPPPSYDDMVEPAPTDQEVTESGMDPAPVGGAANGTTDLEPVAECRKRSQSIWIYFPHVELVYLMYAIQGSLSAQIEVLRHGEYDSAIFYVAAIALVRTNRSIVGYSSVLCYLKNTAKLREGSHDRYRTGTYPRDRSGSKALFVHPP